MTTKFLIKVLAFGVFVGMMTGCQTPEEAPTLEQCKVTNHLSDTFNYSCEDGTYRCTNSDGSTKYKDCWYDGNYCVEMCQ